MEETTAVLNGVPAAEIRSQLDLILRSRAFIQSHRIRRFLQFVVEESLLGQPHRLKEYLIGLEVFDRREAFDPRVDSIVRVEARRLRYKLEEYYRTEGREDGIRIILRKGSYVPIFEYRSASTGAAPASPRRSMEIGLFSLINATSEKDAADAGAAAEEIQRRLAHVLIKEGCFQVVLVKSPGVAPGGEAATGTAPVGISESVASPSGAVAAPGTTTDYVIEGSMELQDDHFRLLLQLQQGADRSYIWSETTDGRLQDLSCVDHLAQQLVRDLAAPPKEGVIARRQSDRKESGDAYLQGRYHWKLATPDSIRNSIGFFTKAVEADPNYAAAWAALAEALLVSSVFGLLPPGDSGPWMKQAALRAIALNPSLPEGHVALGRFCRCSNGTGPLAKRNSKKAFSWIKATRSATWRMPFNWCAGACKTRPSWRSSAPSKRIPPLCSPILFWDGCTVFAIAMTKPSRSILWFRGWLPITDCRISD